MEKQRHDVSLIERNRLRMPFPATALLTTALLLLLLLRYACKLSSLADRLQCRLTSLFIVYRCFIDIVLSRRSIVLQVFASLAGGNENNRLSADELRDRINVTDITWNGGSGKSKIGFQKPKTIDGYMNAPQREIGHRQDVFIFFSKWQRWVSVAQLSSFGLV
jgi:hypothetical protein